MATSSSLEKLDSRPVVVFMIIPTSLICIMGPTYPGAVVIGTAFKFDRETQRKIHLHVFTSVHVLPKTLTLAILVHVVVVQRTAKKCTK